jgi:hypothetical protein
MSIALSHKERKILALTNLVMLAVIVVHDADHVRQARNWCYTIPPGLLFVNVLVYLPNGLALLLVAAQQRIAALATSATGLFVAFGFAKVHLWGSSAVWGLWSNSFFRLGADTLSWIILALTVAIGLGVGMVGAYVAIRRL